MSFWFKNLTLFRLSEHALPDFATLDAALSRRPFHPCSGLDWFAQGWSTPSPHCPDIMVFPQKTQALISLRREDKVLPASVIRELTDEKVAEVESTEHRTLGRKEKLELKARITDDLLPKAFVRRSHIRALLAPTAGWLVVDSSQAARAEELLSSLREAVPPLPARLVHTALSPETAMTQWLLDEPPAGFALDADCELKSPEADGAVVRCVRQDLSADEIRRHLESGKRATRLGLIWQDRIRFVLTDTLQIKRLQFLDILQEEASQAGDDMPSLFEASLHIMGHEIVALCDALMLALGGEITLDGSAAEISEA